ncbi:hypothetical protein GCM10010914_28150 [Deinococcus wulumuqiensis]|uniref:Serine protease n=2 Tax=Deinococcus wulumuqiensis TaxID=980427 RepID=A0AAV4KBL5_9DEIO|nr:hypothetical protein GCM10010914_28150 [Deinococcus wulumuqiensis]GGP31012.1 hypothetical protein GCM10008021_26630 [Deinococcus wulumuqiensis]
MPLLVTSSMSLASLYVEALFDETVLSSATAFYWLKPGFGTPHLITNWHVVSGRNAEDGSCLSKTGGVPNQLRVYSQPAGPSKDAYIYTIPLIVDSKQQWIEHPEGRKVDVVAIPLLYAPLYEPEFSTYPINANPNVFYADIQTVVTSEVFILGYPNGFRHKPWFPIWKRGTIATEPYIDFDERPIFLVDALTRASMSGSPVIQMSNSNYINSYGEVEFNGSQNVKFLGIYSGRIDSSRVREGIIYEGAELGRVFRREVIGEILDDSMMARFGKEIS